MLSICCVLKSGGQYHGKDVQRLWRSVARNLQYDEFVCYTDREAEVLAFPDAKDHAVHTRPLLHHWPGWWSKIEMFSKRWDGDARVLYFDLDTVIVGELDQIAKREEPWIMLGDLYQRARRPEAARNSRRKLASGMMMWNGNEQHDIYSGFARTPVKLMTMLRGDQDWIGRKNPGAAVWQDIVPDQVVSYKVHCGDGLPAGARVVCFHGTPKPGDVDDKWVIENWRNSVPAAEAMV